MNRPRRNVSRYSLRYTQALRVKALCVSCVGLLALVGAINELSSWRVWAQHSTQTKPVVVQPGAFFAGKQKPAIKRFKP